MLRVLIVEDERPISELIRMSLTGAGYRCACVYDGLAAADILEQETFDLILLDVMLPGADGFELMEYIRPREIPVIFLTARGSVGGPCPGAETRRGRLSGQAVRNHRAAGARRNRIAALS